MAAVDDPVKAYRQAERRLREILLGDGSVTIGAVKGEERRIEVTRIMRRMREAFEAGVEHDARRAEDAAQRARDAEARLADLEEALRDLVARSRDRSQAA